MMDSMNPCCCCLLRLPEKDLKTPYVRLGATEIFADMLEECFQIQLAVNEDDWGICEECIVRLRDASDFKLQVQRSQKKLWARPGLHHVKKEPECESKTDDVVYNEDISIEIMPTPDMKSEAAPVSESAQPGPSTEQLATFPNTDTKLYETVHQCDICLATFTLESNLALHMKKTHDNFAIQKNEASDTYEKQFTMFCSGSQANKSGQVRRPYTCQQVNKTDQVRRPYTCQQVNKTDQVRRPYTCQQVNKTGQVRRPYTCRFCDVVFQNRKLLNEHKRDIHKMKKVHSCHICGKVFKKKYMCTEHVLTHTGEKPFVCEICNEKFIAHRWLTTHMRIHNGNVFICDVCNKQYLWKCKLVLHMRVHSGDKPYLCETCKMEFTNRGNLEQHKAVHSNVKSYSCDVCEKRFRRKEHLKSHSLVHSKQKPYSCDICDLKFTGKSHVKRHKRNIHAQLV